MQLGGAGERESERRDDHRLENLRILCPNCHKQFKLNETLAAPIIAQTRPALSLSRPSISFTRLGRASLTNAAT
jgi:hypothetical protein